MPASSPSGVERSTKPQKRGDLFLLAQIQTPRQAPVVQAQDSGGSGVQDQDRHQAFLVQGTRRQQCQTAKSRQHAAPGFQYIVLHRLARTFWPQRHNHFDLSAEELSLCAHNINFWVARVNLQEIIPSLFRLVRLGLAQSNMATFIF